MRLASRSLATPAIRYLLPLLLRRELTEAFTQTGSYRQSHKQGRKHLGHDFTKIFASLIVLYKHENSMIRQMAKILQRTNFLLSLNAIYITVYNHVLFPCNNIFCIPDPCLAAIH